MYLLLGFIIDIWSSTINDPILLLHIYSYFEDIKHFSFIPTMSQALSMGTCMVKNIYINLAVCVIVNNLEMHAFQWVSIWRQQYFGRGMNLPDLNGQGIPQSMSCHETSLSDTYASY